MKSGQQKAASTKDTVSSLPGGRNGSAVMTGESPVQEVDNRMDRATASEPQTGRRCVHDEIMHGLTHAGGGSSVTGRLGGSQLASTLSVPQEENETLWESSPRPSGSQSYG